MHCNFYNYDVLVNVKLCTLKVGNKYYTSTAPIDFCLDTYIINDPTGEGGLHRVWVRQGRLAGFKVFNLNLAVWRWAVAVYICSRRRVLGGLHCRVLGGYSAGTCTGEHVCTDWDFVYPDPLERRFNSTQCCCDWIKYMLHCVILCACVSAGFSFVTLVIVKPNILDLL